MPEVELTGRGGSSSAKQTQAAPPRTISVRSNETITNAYGLGNAITTTKYTLLSWIPVSVWEQFRRIANFYFLIISILMLIGTYATYLYSSPLNPFSTIGTLLFVLMVTSFKEGYEDYQRYKSDKEENERKVTVIKFVNGEVVEQVIQSQAIKAGDIIKMEGKTQLSADVLIILTSNYAEGNQCYIETANIDGETNLKVREAPPALASLASDGKPKVSLFSGTIEFEPPNKDIHTFIGALHLDSMEDPIPLTAENIILRGALFSNTDWVYAIALYTGQETKIQMNNRLAKSKMSKMEKYLNSAIVIIFFAQMLVVVMSVISVYILGFQRPGRIPYVDTDGKISTSIMPLWLEQWFVFFLLYNNLIPISLYVTIEIVNVGQSIFIASDLNIYESDLDLPCLVRSSNLCQELGLVSNIFSDKTGTLTRNEMKLVKFIVDGNIYDVTQESSPAVIDLATNKRNSKGAKVFEFLRCLMTCHTVVRESDGTYRAESPDELALVQGVGVFGCNLHDRGTISMTVEFFGERQQYEILAVNAFNADRKRMSVLIRNVATNEYLALCKGADNIMLPLCVIDAQTLRTIDSSLMDLATLGLRTLCIAQKKLSPAQATEWLARFKSAGASLQERSMKLGDIAAELETNMQLLGITAIEDRLQDEVPEVIADFAKAGIVLWMLTGDKEETAVNIGRSCNLVLSETKIFFITRLERSDAYNMRLKEVYEDIFANFTPGKGYSDQGVVVEVALVMDGPSFRFFDEKDKDQRKWLLFIGQSCRAVIACRLTPIQKQQLVGLVKKDRVPTATTLSIGDGANDVSMIREADVGVGIFGKEGRQAANNADFAVGQFKHLRRLLLVHGRWNYSRQSRVFLFSMHKNMVMTMTLFWFTYFSAVSGTTTYETWIYSSFNFVLGLPIIFYGMQDRDISDKFACKNPQVYSTGRNNVYLTVRAIGLWITNAICFAVIICLVFYYVVFQSFSTFNLFSFGTTVFVGMCNSLQLKVAFMQHQWTWPQAFVYFISIGGMLLFNVVVALSTYDYWYVATHLYQTGIFWFFGFFSVPLITVFVDVILYYLVYFFHPTQEMIFREAEHVVDYAQDWLPRIDLFGTSRPETLEIVPKV